MGSGFPGQKGQDCGINRKKMGEKAGSENPTVDPPLFLLCFETVLGRERAEKAFISEESP